MRQLDSRLVAERKLDIFCYQLLFAGAPAHDAHAESLEWLKDAGFKVNPHYRVCPVLQMSLPSAEEWEGRRDGLNYETDGVVVKGQPDAGAGRAWVQRRSRRDGLSLTSFRQSRRRRDWSM